jgi:pimeloyl-ACP methyl ester carboxylesterase
VPNPRNPKPGRPHLRRDGQQWIFDYMVKETGLPYHWWSGEKPSLPSSVHSHAMISKHVGRQAQAKETAARRAHAEGDQASALRLYFEAARAYMRAQHPIFEVNAEKRFLYDGLRRCYRMVQQLAPYRIERVEISWEGHVVAGWLHLCPGADRAPLLFYVPGCDTTCETFPDPTRNVAHARGMHVFSFDGPGLGSSTMTGIRLTADNFERAAAAALDVLAARPEIDPDRIVAYGGGAGSFWALRLAVHDDRLRAVATKSSYADKYYLADEDSPRYKQLFAFLTQSESEDELDQVLAGMSLDGQLSRIRCPTLMVTGEYDHRDPVEEVFRLFDQLGCPAELWVFADQFHKVRFAGRTKVFDVMLDWLVDRLAGVPMPDRNQVLYIEPDSEGLDGPSVSHKRRWYEPDTPGTGGG